jgi:hypothetical protein
VLIFWNRAKKDLISHRTALTINPRGTRAADHEEALPVTFYR